MSDPQKIELIVSACTPVTTEERIKSLRDVLEENTVLCYLPPKTIPRWRYIDRDDVAFLLAEYDKVKKELTELQKDLDAIR